MKTYELVVVGRATGRTVESWAPAKRDAQLAAARLSAAVEVWRIGGYDPHGRELRGTVFPDGRWAWERPLHRQPRGL